MKSYPSLNSDTGCGNGWSSICVLCVAWALDVKHPRFLALCIRRTPVLSVKICVKKCVLYARKYGSYLMMMNYMYRQSLIGEILADYVLSAWSTVYNFNLEC